MLKGDNMSDVMTELLDVLDENGKQTGQVEPKQVIYDNGYWYRTVHIWVINDNNELLVQKRNPNKRTYPNMWAISAAGHVLTGESSIESGIRELKEELDIEIKPEELKYLFTIKRAQPYKNSYLRTFDDVYIVHKNIDVDKTKVQVEELTDIKYIYYKYLETILLEKDKEYVPYCLEHKKLFEMLDQK